MTTSPNRSEAKNAPLKRFLAIFFLICAIVLGIQAAGNSSNTGALVGLGVAALVCLGFGAFLARSFAFLQKREF